jgi:XTP/dITP diphosphohydrolase
MKIVLASNNAGKLKEFQELFSVTSVTLQPQAELGVADVEETGLSFIENALLKARNAAKCTGLPAIADDSGLCVDYLKGEPGIYSARYAGTHGDRDANVAKLHEKMLSVDKDDRKARFVCVLAFIRFELDPVPTVVQATWEGEIAQELQGGGGFGYDPLFLIPSLGCTAAELDDNTKNKLSHRAQAMEQLMTQLRGELC